MKVAKTVVVNKKTVQRCWIDQRFKCVHPEYDVRRKCVVACRIYRRWAWRLRARMNQLKREAEELERLNREEPLDDKGRILSW